VHGKDICDGDMIIAIWRSGVVSRAMISVDMGLSVLDDSYRL